MLETIESRAAQEGRDGSLIAILAVTARARAALGERSRARELLARAVELAAPDGYRRTFLDEGQSAVPLLKDIRSTAPDFVADLLSRIGAAPRRRPTKAARTRTVEGMGVIEPLTSTQQTHPVADRHRHVQPADR
ncbi:tetratricopeptide repeat protein [Fodinicola feengrottensis]|uniref:hypothetical protein n=1 Tax=Fodinicola feengrottensis TaxID=435914 RepID=UPI0024427569|nr:hypothetical protein [Fodinicola feengrottensis]